MSKALRERREALGKDLDDASSVTKVKKTFLRFIEEEEYSRLPLPVYTRGYIREYARYLGVSADDAVAPYEEYLVAPPEKKDKSAKTGLVDISESTGVAPTIDKGEAETAVKPKAPMPSALKSPEPSEPFNTGVKQVITGLSPRALTIVTAVLVLAVMYGYYSLTDIASPPVMPPAPKQPPYVAPVAAPNPVEPASAVAPQVPATPEPPAAPAVSSRKHRLEITATDAAWVRVVPDEGEPKEALLQKGDVLSVEADKSMTAVIGNAGGVSIKYNGKTIPAGEKGEVMQLALPPSAKPNSQ